MSKWWLSGAIGIAACGTAQAPGSTTASGGQAGSGGAAGAPPIVLVGGAGGTVSLGGTAAGGSNGAAGGFTWTNEEFGPVPPGTACQEGLSVMEGEVAGKAFANGYRAWPHVQTFSSWWYSWLAPHGRTQVFTKAPQPAGYFDPRSTLVAGMAYPVRGWLSLDEEGPDPKAIYCLNEGSTLTPGAKVERNQPLEMSLEFSKLGSCPGTPVAGNLSFCHGQTTDPSCPRGVTGELEGAPLTTTFEGIVGMTLPDVAIQDESTFLFGERWVRLRFPTAGGPIESGMLLTAGDSFELSNVYCLDGGTATMLGASSYKIDVTSLSKLGSCGAAPKVGSARLCTVAYD